MHASTLSISTTALKPSHTETFDSRSIIRRVRQSLLSARLIPFESQRHLLYLPGYFNPPVGPMRQPKQVVAWCIPSLHRHGVKPPPDPLLPPLQLPPLERGQTRAPLLHTCTLHAPFSVPHSTLFAQPPPPQCSTQHTLCYPPARTGVTMFSTTHTFPRTFGRARLAAMRPRSSWTPSRTLKA